jgi:predicted nuclease of predicted toxin-antitoxin system
MIFLIDMNLPPAWREMLTFDDCSALHWSEVGRGNDSDLSIIEYARNHDCVIVTQDLDFGDILQYTGATKPSVIQIRLENTDPQQCRDAVTSLLRLVNNELAAGALVTLSPRKHRVRVLPFPSSTKTNES